MAQRLQRRRKFFVPGADKAAVPAAPEAEAPGEGPTVGRELRAAREKLGWALEDLETSLKIRFSVLQAIENSRFDVLPGSTYALGFVRAYARFLRLDAEEMVRRYKIEAGAFGTPARLSFPSPAYESRLPRDVVIIVSIIVAGIAYGVWYYTTASDRAPMPRVAAVPEQLAALASRPPESSPSQAEAAAIGNRQPAVEPADSSMPAIVEPPAAMVAVPPTSPAPQIAALPPPVQAVDVPDRPTVPPAPAPQQRRPNAATPTPAPAPAAPARSPNVIAQPPAPMVAPTVAPTPQIAAAPPAAPSLPIPARPAAPVAGAPPPPPSLVFNSPAPTIVAPTPAAPQAPVLAAVPPAEPSSRITLNPPPAREVVPGESRIVIRATAEVWVEVRDTARTPVFMKLMRRGDVYAVPNRPGLTLNAGRASAITMTVDGEPVEVKNRLVPLEADTLRRVGG